MRNIPEKKRFPYIKAFAVIIFILLFTACLILYFYPVKHMDLINKYSEKYNLRPEFVCAVINTESGFDKNETSKKGARGLMQIMKTTADWVNSKEPIENYNYENIYDPELNIHIGCRYLSWLNEKYENNRTLVLAAYNAGTGNLAKWLSDEKYSSDGNTLTKIPFKETEDYVKKVNAAEKFYKYILKLPFINNTKTTK